MKAVTLERLEKTFGDGTRAVRGVDLAIEPGELVVLLGPSGCGKTTTLRMIAGLEQPSSGRILLGEEDVTRLRPARRDVGFVFQLFALYPHFSVRENIAFPLACTGVPGPERARRVEEVAERLGLTPLLALRPRQLSGGDQQRVSLARAMVRRPAVWLMDEPLGTLDTELRLALCEFLRAQQLELGVTTVYVTHDQDEAMRLADRIVVMSEGSILQADSAARVYDDPADLFVARFVGSPGMNFVMGEVRATAEGARFLPAPPPTPPHPEPPPTLGGAAARPGRGRSGFDPSRENLPGVLLPPAARATPPGPVVLGFRPEALSIDAESPLRGLVVVDEYLGSARCLHLDTELGRLVARSSGDGPDLRGATIGLRIDPLRVRLFEPGSGKRLS